MLLVLSVVSLQIRACDIVFSPNVIQWYFQGINIDPVTDLSRKSMKDSLISLPFAKKSYLVLELYYLFTH